MFFLSRWYLCTFYMIVQGSLDPEEHQRRLQRLRHKQVVTRMLKRIERRTADEVSADLNVDDTDLDDEGVQRVFPRWVHLLSPAKLTTRHLFVFENVVRLSTLVIE